MRHLILSFLFVALTLVPLFYVSYVEADASHEAELATVIASRERLEDSIDRAEHREARPARNRIWTELPRPKETDDDVEPEQELTEDEEADAAHEDAEVAPTREAPDGEIEEFREEESEESVSITEPEQAEPLVEQPEPEPEPEPVQLTAELTQEIFALMNAERADAGLSPLAHDPALSVIASAHSEDMAAHEYLAHADEEGCALTCRFTEHEYKALAWAENIAVVHKSDLLSDAKVAARIVESWMGSGGHRENMLNSEYTHVGVGFVYSGRSVYVTTDFAAF